MNLNNYPHLGAHTSIAGGIFNAIYNGQKIGCDVVQIFSKNQMQWQGRPISHKEIDKLHEAIQETGILPVSVHTAYLINLGNPQRVVYRKSFYAFIDELIRCEFLSIPFLVMHPGSYLDSSENEGLNCIAKSIQSAYHKSGVTHTTVLLETTAGQGTNLGYRYEQLKYIIDESDLRDNIGVCVDTCHIFAAGYDIRTKTSWEETKKEIQRIVGLGKLKLFHFNDCKGELGSRIDRHARIGKGKIGLRGFINIINDPDMQKIPMILEIPGGDVAYEEDLELLRQLIKKNNKKDYKLN